MPEITVRDRTILVDKNGYLVHVDDWDKDVARVLADGEMIEMTDDHWEIVDFLRNFYAEWKMPPPSRAFLKKIRDSLGAKKASGKHLYGLFPKGPAKQAYKIAGLPHPS